MKADLVRMDKVFGNVVSSIDSVSKWREKKTPLPETKMWDRNPVIMKRKGVLCEFFTIGALAEALGRQTGTIRAWEDKKIIPLAPFREPAPPTANLPERVAKGRRLYTHQQIEAAIAAAKASGVYETSNALSANWPEFTRLVRLAWSTL